MPKDLHDENKRGMQGKLLIEGQRKRDADRVVEREAGRERSSALRFLHSFALTLGIIIAFGN